jgi:aminopeptidase
MESIHARYAKVLVNYSLGLKKGDRLYINSTYLSEPLVLEVYKEALKIGAYPELGIGLDGTKKALYDHGSEKQLKYVSPLFEKVIDEFEAYLTIHSSFNVKELTRVPPEKKKIVSMAMAAVQMKFMKRMSEGSLKWTGCEFPTSSAAQEAGMSLSEYEEFVYGACLLDTKDPVEGWEQVRKTQARWTRLLEKRSRFRIIGKDIDVSFNAKNRKWINACGQKNMPDGEVFTTPLETSVNGKVRFSFPAIYQGQEVEDVTLEIKNGEVVSWDALKGKGLLDEIMKIPGARRFGETAVGTNYGIKNFTKNILFDEKIGGTIHMAVGAAIPMTGGKNECAIHWDLIADMKNGGEIYADDELIYKNGKFVI